MRRSRTRVGSPGGRRADLRAALEGASGEQGQRSKLFEFTAGGVPGIDPPGQASSTLRAVLGRKLAERGLMTQDRDQDRGSRTAEAREHDEHVIRHEPVPLPAG